MDTYIIGNALNFLIFIFYSKVEKEYEHLCPDYKSKAGKTFSLIAIQVLKEVVAVVEVGV